MVNSSRSEQSSAISYNIYQEVSVHFGDDPPSQFLSSAFVPTARQSHRRSQVTQ